MGLTAYEHKPIAEPTQASSVINWTTRMPFSSSRQLAYTLLTNSERKYSAKPLSIEEENAAKKAMALLCDGGQW